MGVPAGTDGSDMSIASDVLYVFDPEFTYADGPSASQSGVPDTNEPPAFTRNTTLPAAAAALGKPVDCARRPPIRPARQ